MLQNALPASQAFLVSAGLQPGVNRRQLRQMVGAALDRGERHIVMDCSAWSSPDDVVAFSTLVGCAQLCADKGAGFEITNLSSSVHEALRELRLTPRLGLSE